MVREIQWTPIYLYKRYLDAELWTNRYTNLLTGLTHSECADLHRIFTNVIRREIKRANDLTKCPTKDPSIDFAAFFNCRQVRFSNISDIETRCADRYLRSRIQRDKKLLNQVTAWGLCSVNNPFFREGDDSSRIGPDKTEELSLLIDRLPSMFHVCITTSTSDKTAASLVRKYVWSKVETMHLQVHFFYHTDIELGLLHSGDYDKVTRRLQELIYFSACFPNLRSLTLEPIYTDPGPKFNEPYRLEYLAWLEAPESTAVSEDGTEDEIGDVSRTWLTSPRSSFGGRRLSRIDDRFDEMPDGFDRHHLNAMEAELTLGITKIPNLREFSLGNISLNVQSLVGWLANQPQVPEYQITLHLHGNNILYGFNPQSFLQLLEVLNVRLLLDDDGKTLYYESGFEGHSTSFCALSFQIPHAKHKHEHSAMFQSSLYDGFFLDEIVWDNRDGPRELSDLMILRAARNKVSEFTSVTFIDRPEDVGNHFQRLNQALLSGTNLYYCCLIRTSGNGIQHQVVTFQWLDHPMYCRYERESKKEKEIQQLILIFTTRAYSHELSECDGHFYGYNERCVIEDEADIRDIMNKEDRWESEQELLATYENELLRLDVTGL